MYIAYSKHTFILIDVHSILKTVASTWGVTHFDRQLDAGVSFSCASLLTRDAISGCLPHLLIPCDGHVDGELKRSGICN